MNDFHFIHIKLESIDNTVATYYFDIGRYLYIAINITYNKVVKAVLTFSAYN